VEFYVYTLTDPRTGAVFYVGKGKRARAYQHVAEALRPNSVNQRKCALIRDILDAGHVPSVAIVQRYELEADAIEHEADLIASMQGLTNILARGWSLTAEEAARRTAAREERVKREKALRHQEWLRVWLDRVSRWPGVTFPGLRDGDRKAEEFVCIVRDLVAEPI
jgi:hypothetical protein